MEIYHQEFGNPAQPAILFLHGSPLSGRMWQPQVKRLTEYFCIVPDLPGHARSADIAFSMQDTLDRLTELIQDVASGGKAHLIGLSFGGVIAQAMMLQYPELVDHVLMSGTATRMSRWLINLQRLNEPIMKMLSPKQLANMVARQFGIPSEYLPSMSADFESFSVTSFSSVMQCYGEITMPSGTKSATLICVGSRETGFAKSMAKQLENGIPNSKRLVIPGGTHVWNMQLPDLFCDVTRAWFEGKVLPAGLVFE